jgi:hypothetical protein
MMRLILAPKSMDGTKEKLLKSRDQNQAKKSPKIAKIKNIAASLSLLSSPLLHHEAHPYFSKNNYG